MDQGSRIKYTNHQREERRERPPFYTTGMRLVLIASRTHFIVSQYISFMFSLSCFLFSPLLLPARRLQKTRHLFSITESPHQTKWQQHTPTQNAEQAQEKGEIPFAGYLANRNLMSTCGEGNHTVTFFYSVLRSSLFVRKII